MSRTGENIYKRKDGRWEARYIYAYDSEGKAKYKYLYDATYSGAKTKLLHAFALAGVKPKCSDGDSYRYWLDRWLCSKKPAVKPSTYMRYKANVENHIKPLLGKYQLEKITTNIIEDFISYKLSRGRLDGEGGLSAKTAQDILVIIKESFKYASLCGASVICRFDRMIIKRKSNEMRVLTPIEEKRLISVLMEEPDRYKMGVFICLYTGIRIGELCALQWESISLSERTLKVKQTLLRLQCDYIGAKSKTEIMITEPKSRAAKRTIPLPDFLVEKLERYKSQPSAYFLSGCAEKCIEPRVMQNKFKTYLKEGGIEDANFHALRHTFATRCAEAGFDIKTLSEILGHSGVKITLEKYVHSSMELKRSNMDKLKLMI